jgi:hypothetical protein
VVAEGDPKAFVTLISRIVAIGIVHFSQAAGYARLPQRKLLKAVDDQLGGQLKPGGGIKDKAPELIGDGGTTVEQHKEEQEGKAAILADANTCLPGE